MWRRIGRLGSCADLTCPCAKQGVRDRMFGMMLACWFVQLIGRMAIHAEARQREVEHGEKNGHLAKMAGHHEGAGLWLSHSG